MYFHSQIIYTTQICPARIQMLMAKTSKYTVPYAFDSLQVGEKKEIMENKTRERQLNSPKVYAITD